MQSVVRGWNSKSQSNVGLPCNRFLAMKNTNIEQKFNFVFSNQLSFYMPCHFRISVIITFQKFISSVSLQTFYSLQSLSLFCDPPTQNNNIGCTMFPLLSWWSIIFKSSRPVFVIFPEISTSSFLYQFLCSFYFL